MTFIHPSAALFLLLIPAYLLVYLHSAVKKRQNLLYMTGKSSNKGRVAVPFLVSLSILFLTLGGMRPVSNPRMKSVEQKGRNIVFVIDVSRSMLAEDLIPNRLERARFDIMNSVDSLRGNRVALVAFAGVPVLKCPLTLDYLYFNQALSELGTNSVSRGGTHMGDAIRTVIEDLFDKEDRESLDIILITDGEDQESFPVESAARAGKDGIRIVAIGLGNQDEGAPVPSGEKDNKDILMYKDKPVYSKADMKTLQKMADSSAGGWAVPVKSGKIPIDKILRQMNSSAPKKTTGKVDQYEYDEHFRWFLIPGIFCLVMAFFMENRLLRRMRRI